MKMSKSLGNTVNPLDLMKEYGADILRLWALSVDFTEDHRIGKEILAGVADQYRKLRNTFRYLLGALDGFSEEERLDDVAAYARARALHAAPDRRARREAAQGGRRLRLQHLRPRADRLLQRGSVAPSTSISARTASIATRRSIAEAPRLPDRARHAVPRAGALAGAGAGVHHRGSVGHALSGRRARCICSNGRRSRRSMRDDAKLGAAARASRRRSPKRSSRCAATRCIGSSLEAEVTVPELPRTRSCSPSCSSSRQSAKAMRSR